MEPSRSNELRRMKMRKAHQDFASEATDYYQQYYEFKPDGERKYLHMTKAIGDAIFTISYLFRDETLKTCRLIRDYIVEEENFVNYCRVIKVEGGNRFFYNYLRRVSLILEMAAFCFRKGHDFFNIASKYIGIYEYRDMNQFEIRGGWQRLNKVAEFIGSCGDRLNMITDKETPGKKVQKFIEVVNRLKPLYYDSKESIYHGCFFYMIEIRWKLTIENTAGSPEDSESNPSSDEEDQDLPDSSLRALTSKAARYVRESRLEGAEEPRPSTSRETVTSSKEVKDLRIPIEGDDEKAILDYLLRCCSKRKRFGHLGESIDSEASNATSVSTESEAESVLEYSVKDSSDSEDEFTKTSRLQLVDLKELRRKRKSEDSRSKQHEKGTSKSASVVATDEPHCSGEKIPRLSSEEPKSFVIETDTSTDELSATSDEKSEESSQSGYDK